MALDEPFIKEFMLMLFVEALVPFLCFPSPFIQ